MFLKWYFLYISYSCQISESWFRMLLFFSLISNINTQEWSQKHIKQSMKVIFLWHFLVYTLHFFFFLLKVRAVIGMYQWVWSTEIKKNSLKGFWRCHPNHYIKYDSTTINDNVIVIRNAQYLNYGHYVVETQRLVMIRGRNDSWS